MWYANLINKLIWLNSRSSIFKVLTYQFIFYLFKAKSMLVSIQYSKILHDKIDYPSEYVRAKNQNGYIECIWICVSPKQTSA